MMNTMVFLAVCQVDKKGVVQQFQISTNVTDLVFEVNRQPQEGYNRKAFTDYTKAVNYIEGFLSFEDKFRFKITDGFIPVNRVFMKERD